MTTSASEAIKTRVRVALEATEHPPVPEHIEEEMPPSSEPLGKISAASATLCCLLVELGAELDKITSSEPVDLNARAQNLADGQYVQHRFLETVGTDFELTSGKIAIYGNWQAARLPQVRNPVILFMGAKDDARVLQALLAGRLRQ